MISPESPINPRPSPPVLGVMFLLFVIGVTGFFVMWFTEFYNNTMLEVSDDYAVFNTIF